MSSRTQNQAPAPAMPHGSAAVSPRLVYFDNLRAALTVLVVLHHCAVTYTGLPLWYYFEESRSSSATALLDFAELNQSFFMGFFFLIAGYFVPTSFDRKGGRAFWRGRLVRLGIPLLVFLVLLRPLAGLATYRFQIIDKGIELPYWVFYLLSIDPGPMWFAELLLIFSLGYLTLRRITRRRPLPAASDGTPTYLGLAGVVVGLAVATFVLRLAIPIGFYVPVLGFPTLAWGAQYLGFFVLGTLAYRRNWFAGIPTSMGWVCLGVALAAVIAFWPVATGGSQSLGGWHLQAAARACFDAVFSVAICTATLVLFRDRLNRQGRFARFLSTHAFTVYVIHAVLVTGFGVALIGVTADPLVKFALLAVLSLPASWGLAYLVRALPGAERVL